MSDNLMAPCPRRTDCMRRNNHRGDCSHNLAEAVRNILRSKRTGGAS